MRCSICQFETAEGVSRCIFCGHPFSKPTPQQGPERGKTAAGSSSKKRVYALIVEDDEACAKMISTYLGDNGIAWRTECSDAMQAVVQAESLKVGIVLMDIMLPRFGSGVEAYGKLRQSPYLPKDLPVIFYTAMDEQRARAMMPNDPKVRLLFKPLHLPLLLNTIRELTGDLLFRP